MSEIMKTSQKKRGKSGTSEALDALKKMLSWKSQIDSRITIMRSDKGEGYAAFNTWRDEQGKEGSRTTACQQQQKKASRRTSQPVAEREVRAVLVASSIPKQNYAWPSAGISYFEQWVRPNPNKLVRGRIVQAIGARLVTW
jgi:hypothetical protein